MHGLLGCHGRLAAALSPAPCCLQQHTSLQLMALLYAAPQPQVDVEGRRVSLYRPGHQQFLLEPKFVPRPGATEEDDGWLLSVGFHSGAPLRTGLRRRSTAVQSAAAGWRAAVVRCRCNAAACQAA